MVQNCRRLVSHTRARVKATKQAAINNSIIRLQLCVRSNAFHKYRNVYIGYLVSQRFFLLRSPQRTQRCPLNLLLQEKIEVSPNLNIVDIFFLHIGLFFFFLFITLVFFLSCIFAIFFFETPPERYEHCLNGCIAIQDNIFIIIIIIS